jgi:hypothetical protein
MKSRKYVEQGAGRYVVGHIEAFDQKNEMFKRPFWDPQMKALGKKFYFTSVPPRDKSGYGLHDQSIVNASWRLNDEFANGGRRGLYDWNWDGNFWYPRVPPGLKISETDPDTLTRWVKKAAAFFGASLVGVCKLDHRWLYSSAYLLTSNGGKETENHIPDEYQYAIAIAVEMDYKSINCSPAGPSSVATGLGYSQMAYTAGLLAQFIRGLGYQAIPCKNRGRSKVLKFIA